MMQLSKSILLIAPFMIVTTAIAGGPSQVGSITADDPTWDRPSPTGTFPNGICNVPAADSLNDGVHHDVYYIRGDITAVALNATINSLEMNPIDFDPMAVVYCGVFDPAQPGMNVIDIDDDSNGYPNTFISAESAIDINQVYSLVVSSYSNHAPSQFGDYVVDLAPGLYFSTTCIPDFSGDGMLNFFDISAFINLYSAGDLAADLNLDGALDFSDVSLFLNEFGAGCP